MNNRTHHEIVFIESNVRGYRTLLNGVAPGTEHPQHASSSYLVCP